jgi:DNA-binding CsgD family transcriptional regulator
LTPHIQRAARISRRLGEADMRVATASEMLNSSPYGVIALGPDLEYLMANQSGQALLERDYGFSLTNGRLTVERQATARQLADMAAGRSSDRSITFTTGTSIGRELVMTAVAVTPGQGEQFAMQAGGAALMLVGGQRFEITDTSTATLQAAFNLTAAEARLACFLIKGTGVKGYSADRGVSDEAGRYLLKGIYAKTGLSNQTELVALLREAPIGWGTPLPSLPA